MSNSVFSRIRSFGPSTLIIAGILLALLMLSVSVSGTNGSLYEETKAPMPVVARQVRQLDGYQVDRFYVGRVEARRESDAGFELGGLIEEVFVDDGDKIVKGEIIARLDTALLRAQRAELVAARARAIAQMDLADSTRSRVREASDLDAVSVQVLDEAEQGYSTNVAALNGASSAIATLDVQLEKSELRAPYDAVVSMRYLDEGQVIAAGSPVVRLLEDSRPEVRIGVASDAIKQLEVGRDYNLRIGGRSVVGRLRAILPERRANTRGVDVVFELAAEFNGIRRGDLVELVLRDDIATSAFRLPVGALTESARGIWAVYVIVEDDQGSYLDRRQVELLHHQGDDVMVRGTLSNGDRVVVAGIHRLVPEQRVEAVPEQANQQLFDDADGGEQ